PFVIGTFVGYDWGESDFDFNLAFPGNGSFSINGTLEPTWHAGIRVGYTPTKRSLLYVGYAYGQAEFDLSVTDTTPTNYCVSMSTVLKCSDTIEGHTFLAGAELALSDTLSTALEYNYTQYDSIPVISYQNNNGNYVRVDAEPDVHSVMLRL